MEEIFFEILTLPHRSNKEYASLCCCLVVKLCCPIRTWYRWPAGHYKKALGQQQHLQTSPRLKSGRSQPMNPCKQWLCLWKKLLFVKSVKRKAIQILINSIFQNCGTADYLFLLLIKYFCEEKINPMLFSHFCLVAFGVLAMCSLW